MLAGTVLAGCLGAVRVAAEAPAEPVRIPFIFVESVPMDTDTQVDVDWDRSEELRIIERTAGRVLEYYDQMGFPEPLLTRFTYAQPGTGKPMPFYPLVMGGTRNQAGASYTPPCSLDETPEPDGFSSVAQTYIRVNPQGFDDGATLADVREFFSDGRRKPWAHVALAHEIFHAIQFASPPFRDCNVDGWVMEGTAVALSRHAVAVVADEKEQVPAYPNHWELLVRPYNEALHVESPREKNAYKTASFWRFLAEEAGQGGKTTPGSFEIEKEDYGYLVKLLGAELDRVADSAGATQQEYRWVDGAARQRGGVDEPGLDATFARFITQYPRYIPDRLDRGDGGGSPRYQSELLVDAMGRCEKVHLTPDKPDSMLTIDLPRFGARCLSVSTDQEGEITVAVGFGSDDEALINRLRVGHVETGRVSVQTTTSRSKDAIGTHYAHWNFKVLASGESTQPRNVFTLVNFPDLAGPFSASGDSGTACTGECPTAKPIDRLSLHVTLPHWSSQTFPPEAQGPPMPRTGRRQAPDTSWLKYLANRPRDATSPVRIAAAPEANADLRLTSFAESATNIQMDLDDPPCSDAFQYRACGPDVRINLTLQPASGLGSVSQVVGSGGFADQLGQQLMSQAAAFARDPDLLIRYRDRMREIRGSEISITTPPFDYGFTGTFTNAQVIVTTPGEPLQALEPTDDIPGRGTRHRLNGRVTIEKYTPYVLRGRVQADLVDRSQAPPGEDAVLPVVDRLDARFVVAAPHLNDRRSVVVAGRPWDNEINRRLYEADPRGGGVTGGAPTESGPSVSSGRAAQCTCTCNEGLVLTPPCDNVCEPVLAACRPAPEDRDAGADEESPTAVAADDPEAMRAAYEEIIRATGAGEGSVVAAMQHFDQMPPAVQKMLLEMQRRGSEDAKAPDDASE